MVVVSLSEGLGNQMFQYALYRALKASGLDARAELSFFDEYKSDAAHPERSYALDCFPAVHPDIASPEELASLVDDGRGLLSRARRKLFGQRGHIRAESYPTRFEPDVLRADNVILRGFWQDPRYFAGAAAEVRADFAFREPGDARNRALLAEIDSRRSAAVHIRRGDYLLHEDIFGGVCTREYYERAAAIMRESFGAEPSWYIFTDDPAWARASVPPGGARVVDINSGADSWKDMLLMSRCRGVTAANSSFSWWAAWLNARADKAVAAPSLGPRGREIPPGERVPGWNYI